MDFINKNILRNENGKRYYSTNLFPLIEPSIDDLYIISTMGDRLDTLASFYYQDSTLWKIIAMCNNIPQDSINVPPGTQLRIISPNNLDNFVKRYESINKR